MAFSTAHGKYSDQTGELDTSNPEVAQYAPLISIDNFVPDCCKGYANGFVIPAPDVSVKSMHFSYYGTDGSYIGDDIYLASQADGEKAFKILPDVASVKCDFTLDLTQDDIDKMSQDDIDTMLNHVWFYVGYELQEEDVHYKKITKKFKKETSQVFFRESLDGTIKLVGSDFDYIDSQNIETKFIFAIVSRNSLSVNSFSKTDCKLDKAKHIIELKLSAIDEYSKIMDKYDNTYDLIKLAPAVTPLTLTKRLLYQFYVQGADSVSCYANGTYWEQETNESIDDADALRNKYCFAKNFNKQEISIDESQSKVYAGTYLYDEDDTGDWINVSNSNKRIHFRGLTADERTQYSQSRLRIISAVSGEFAKSTIGESASNVYKLEFITVGSSGHLGDLESTYYVCTGYTNDGFGPFKGQLELGNNSHMTFKYYGTEDETAFDMRDCVIDYTIWARILADVDKVSWQGTEYTLYDLPADDFVSERVNYRKCIGLIGLNVVQSGETQVRPTKFGRADNMKYFTSNVITQAQTSHLPVPISRSSWTNTSLWAVIPDYWDSFESLFRTTYTLNDAYSLASVIKALLNKINPLIKFKATAEYSQFFYGKQDIINIIPFDRSRVGYEPYIAPKSNVLKSNYDQAAQKAEITFEQLMDMLRDCFRCYWFIEDSKLRIEHISYFMNGKSYSEIDVQLDLTKKQDKFSRKSAIYAQNEIAYSKDDLNSRYEFAWMDDTTDIFEDMQIDIQSQFTQSDKTEEINSEAFTSDIDLMLYAPDKFSEDGFALMMASSTDGKVPISGVSGLRDDVWNYTYRATPQNYLCSWLYLARYYMKDMPASHIKYTRAPDADAYRVTGIKQCMTQDITFQISLDTNIDLNKAIKTTIGNGIIDSMSVNIDTGLIDATLVFVPK